jgi:hypothetical protein
LQSRLKINYKRNPFELSLLHKVIRIKGKKNNNSEKKKKNAQIMKEKKTKQNIKPQETIHNLRDNKVTDEHT